MIRLFLYFLFFVFSFLFFTRKYNNPYRLFLVFGKKGSGKSTYLARVALKYHKKGWNVYSNMPDLAVPGCRFIDAKQLGLFVPERNSLVILDEVGMLYDNRKFKDFTDAQRDFYKLQRHYKVVVYMASQSFDIDKKLRELTDVMFLQVNFARVFSLGKRIRRTVTLTDPVGDMESKICDSLKWAPIWDWTLTFIPRYSRYFNSTILPDHSYIPYKDFVPVSSDLDNRLSIKKLNQLWKK